MSTPQSDHRTGKSQDVFGSLIGLPIEPRDFIVLAISVVIALLGPSAFIAHEKHRNALAEHQRRKKVSDLFDTFSLDCFGCRGSFNTVIFTVVVVITVSVVFAVGLIVFVFEAH